MKDLMKYGLTSQQIEIITRIASKFETAESLILFGSRTKGNFKTSSDIDLCIKGNITFSQLARIKTLLEETTSIPYFLI